MILGKTPKPSKKCYFGLKKATGERPKMLELLKREKYWVLLSAVTMLLAAFFITGVHFPDEHCQILEFLHIKLFKLDGEHLPWEFHRRMRPWFQIFVYFWPLKLFHTLGLSNPFDWVTFLRIGHVLLGLFTNLVLFSVFEKEIKDRFWKRFFFLLMLFSYFFPYLYTRTSSENFGTSLFCLGLVLWLKTKDEKSAILTGLFFGCAFLARNQLAAMIFFLCLQGLIYKKYGIKELSLITVACFAVMGLGVVIDYWGYGEWHFIPWNYYYENIVAGNMAKFGTHPWWWYAYKAQQKPLMLVPVLSFLYFWWRYRHHSLTWLTLGFFLFHSSIAHKEMRFLFPLAPFIPVVVTYALRDFFHKLECTGLRDIWRKLATKAFLLGHGLLYFLALFRPASYNEDYFRYLYRSPERIDKIYYSYDFNPHNIGGFPVYFYRLPDIPYIRVDKIEDAIEDIKEPQFYFFAFSGKDVLDVKKYPQCHEVHPRFNALERFLRYPLLRRERRLLHVLFRCQGLEQ